MFCPGPIPLCSGLVREVGTPTTGALPLPFSFCSRMQSTLHHGRPSRLCLQSLLPLSGLYSKSKLRVGVRPLITGAGCHGGPALAESLCQPYFLPGPGSAAEPPEERVSSAVGTDSCPCPGGWGLQAIAISERVPCHVPHSYGAGTSCAAAQFCFWSSPSPPEPRGAQHCGRCCLLHG